MEVFLVVKRLLALALFTAAAVYGQAATVTPDCVVTFNFTAAAQATPNLSCGHNNTVGIYDWHVLYFSTGFAALSLVVESAPDAGGVPGTWVNFAGTIDNGVNPNTAITQADTRLHGFFPWNRVQLASVTGTGAVQGVFYGCRQPGCSNTQIASAVATAVNLTQIGGNAVQTGGVNGSLGVGGLAANGAPLAGRPVLVGGSDGVDVRDLSTDNTGKLNVNVQGTVPVSGACPNPCPVIGTAANGAAASGNPVRVAGKDNAGNVRDLLMATNGAVIPGNAVAAPASGVAASRTFADDAGNPIFGRNINLEFNGSTFDLGFACTNTAPITFTAASGAAQIVALSGSTVIRICSMLLSSDTVTNITLEYGTGAACAIGTTAISGPLQNVLTFAMSWQPDTALRTAAGTAFCVVSSATATIGGTVTYAQF